MLFMPPTEEEENLAAFREMLRTAVGRKPVEQAVQTIKNFCKFAASYDIKKIIGSYDGSSDSGNMTIEVKTITPQVDAPGEVTGNQLYSEAGAPQYRYNELHRFFRDITSQPDTLITSKTLNDFEDAMYELLPGGWEINDGSYGEITVDVATGEINVEHNERIVEINSSTHTY